MLIAMRGESPRFRRFVELSPIYVNDSERRQYVQSFAGDWEVTHDWHLIGQLAA